MNLIILCGGPGTRLGYATKDKPKALVEVDGVNIIEMVLEPYRDYNYHFAAGYKGLDMARFVWARYPDAKCYIEDKPLGTGGAVKNIAKEFTDDYFAVINGDTVNNFNFNEILNTMKFRYPDQVSCVMIGKNSEREDRMAGAYIFKKSFLDYIEDPPFHLEDAIDKCAIDKKSTSYVTSATFYDLGTCLGQKKFLKKYV